MKKNIVYTLIILVTLTGFSVSGMSQIVVTVRPAAPKVVRVAPPSPRLVWIEGNWIVRGGKYVYVNGYWARPRRNQLFVAGHWARSRGGWVWVPGHWERRIRR